MERKDRLPPPGADCYDTRRRGAEARPRSAIQKKGAAGGSPPKRSDEASVVSSDDGGAVDMGSEMQSVHEFLSFQLKNVEKALVDQHQRVLSLLRKRRPDVNGLEERVDKLLEENQALRSEVKYLKYGNGEKAVRFSEPSRAAVWNRSEAPAWSRSEAPAWNRSEAPARPPNYVDVPLPNAGSPPCLGVTEAPAGEARPKERLSLSFFGSRKSMRGSRATKGARTSWVGGDYAQNGAVAEDAARERTGNFELHEMWTRGGFNRGAVVFGGIGAPGSPWAQLAADRTLSTGATAREFGADEDLDDIQAMTTTTCWRHLMVHPNNKWKGVWDIMSLTLVIYDMVTIPLGVFEMPDSGFLLFMAWVTRIFWSFDMPLSFFSGYITAKGSIEMRPEYVFRKYIQSWLLLDILVVGIDWSEIILAAAAEGFGIARVGRASRVFRVLRMIRLLRLARMKEVLNLLIERLDSEKLVIVVDITKLMVIMLGSGHFVACLWYWVGIQGSKNWVSETHYDKEDLPMRYMMSMRWAISQFAGGMDEVTPESLFEHIYALIVFLWAFWSGAVFLGILTSSMTQLYIIGSTQTTQLTVLRRYLTQNGISKSLSLRVQRNAQHSMAERQTAMPEAAVELINVVSEPLRVELHYEMYSKVVGIHPFFRRYMAECPHVMRKVCHGAVSMAPVSLGDVIFNVGEIPSVPKMFIISKGELVYMTDAGRKTTLGPGDWLSEMTLWVHWVHRGMLTATTDTMMHTIDAKEFQRIASSFEHLSFDPRSYAHDFLEMLNTTPQSEITDMCLPHQAELKVGANNQDAHFEEDEMPRSSVSNPKVRPNAFKSFALPRTQSFGSNAAGIKSGHSVRSLMQGESMLSIFRRNKSNAKGHQVGPVQEKESMGAEDSSEGDVTSCAQVSPMGKNVSMDSNRITDASSAELRVPASGVDGISSHKLDVDPSRKKQAKPRNNSWTVSLIDEEEI